MARMTAAFVCALDDPDNARPASIMCSNNCGRYVCAEHAVERKGPGSPMLCLVCAKALGVLPVQAKAEKIAPKPEPVAAPIMPIEPRKAKRAELEPIDFAPKAEVRPIVPSVPKADVKPIEPPAPRQSDPDVTLAGLSFAPSVKDEASSAISPQGAVPLEEQKVAPSMIEPEAAPKSAASETIVSQRGNTLQVPKVTATTSRTGNTGQMPKVRTGQTGQMPAARPAQRTTEAAGGLQNQTILWAIGAIVLGIIGFVLIVAALNGG